MERLLALLVNVTGARKGGRGLRGDVRQPERHGKLDLGKDREVVVVLRGKYVVTMEQVLFDRFPIPAFTCESMGDLHDELPPLGKGHPNKGHQCRRSACSDVDYCGKRHDKEAALVLDVEFERFGEKHRRATRRFTLLSGEAKC